MAKNASGGETDLLAKAMRTVFSEAAEGAHGRGYQDNQQKYAGSVRRPGKENRTASKGVRLTIPPTKHD